MRAAGSLVKSFISTCVQSIPNLSSVEESAKRLGWKQTEEDVGLALYNSNAESKTWLVEGVAEVPFELNISRLVQGQQITSQCTLANPEAPVAPIKTELVKQLDLDEPIRIGDDRTQRTSFWQSKMLEPDIFISLTESIPAKESGIILRASVIQNPSLTRWVFLEIWLTVSGLFGWIFAGYVDFLTIISILGFISVPGAILSFTNRHAPNLLLIVKIAIVFVSFAFWGFFMFCLRLVTGFPYWFVWLGL